MQMDAGLDTGVMLDKTVVAIDPRETRVSLEEKLIAAGSRALVAAINSLEALQEKAEAQDDSQSTYAAKIDKAESLIEWALPASQIDLLVRACIGRTPAFTLLEGQRIRLLESAIDSAQSDAPAGTVTHVDKRGFSVVCGERSVLKVSRVQMPGKGEVSVGELLNGKPDAFAVGTCFDQPPANEES